MPNEADTCRTFVLPRLQSAGWQKDSIKEQMVLTPGRIVPIGDRRYTRQEGLRPDYTLEIRRNIPIAVVEAKASYRHPADGMQQALRYAEMLGVKFAYSSNGHTICEHDFLTGAETELDSFPSPDNLWQRLKGTLQIQSQEHEADYLSAYYEEVGGKTPRYYQQIAINRALNAVLQGNSRILITMATGTGKTFVAFQIVWRLWKALRKKRILYLSDRNFLIDQAKTRTFSPMGQAVCKIQGRIIKSREMYFALYQALSNPTGGPNLYEKYPKDFFDLIIVDECHRGSARDESSWRKILEYFASSQQIGMTATPKHTDNIDTYEYFGDPVYTYSLKQGIEDGFLAPYRVLRVIPDVDAAGLQIDPGVLDRFNREIPPGLYGTKEFERVISLLSRTETVARHLTDYLKRTDPYGKTIVFCVDQEHAADMRTALVHANQDMVKLHPNYVTRIVSDEGGVGRGHLDDFQDPECQTPVIVTTSQMLTTGVDAPTCRNIVLFRPIGSIVDFKQIIGRGTRVSPEYNKYWFTIIDYVGATRLFYDPAFDGEPVRVTRTQLDPSGQEHDTQDSETGTLPIEPPLHPWEEIETCSTDHSITEPPRKFYLDDVNVYIMGEQVYELDPQDNILRTVQFTDYAATCIKRLVPDAAHLRQVWPIADRRREILDSLQRTGVDPAYLARVTHHENADPLDLLLHVAYDAPLVSRRERADQLRQKKANFLNSFTPSARIILNELLDKYADFGLNQLDDLQTILQVPPFNTYGTPLDIVQLFGGSDHLRQAVQKIETYLYEE